MVGNIHGKNFKDEIYKDFPPHTYKDTLLVSVLQSKAVCFFCCFHNVIDEFKMDGKSLEFVLLNQVKMAYTLQHHKYIVHTRTRNMKIMRLCTTHISHMKSIHKSRGVF